MGAHPITRYTEVGDEQIAFQIIGDGDRDLVWFSGLSNLDLQWADVQTARAFERLSSYGRLLLFDRRGTGISDHLSSGQLPTWEDWSEDLTAVLDAAESERAAIYAVGDAGPMGILFAALHPERVSALVLHNTTARYLVADDYPIGGSVASVERMLAGFEQLWGTEDWACVVEGRGGEGEETLRRVAALTRGMATPRLAKAQWRYLLMEMDVRSALPLVQAPTLVRHNSDFVFPSSHGRLRPSGDLCLGDFKRFVCRPSSRVCASGQVGHNAGRRGSGHNCRSAHSGRGAVADVLRASAVTLLLAAAGACPSHLGPGVRTTLRAGSTLGRVALAGLGRLPRCRPSLRVAGKHTLPDLVGGGLEVLGCRACSILPCNTRTAPVALELADLLGQLLANAPRSKSAGQILGSVLGHSN